VQPGLSEDLLLVLDQDLEQPRELSQQSNTPQKVTSLRIEHQDVVDQQRHDRRQERACRLTQINEIEQDQVSEKRAEARSPLGHFPKAQPRDGTQQKVPLPEQSRVEDAGKKATRLEQDKTTQPDGKQAGGRDSGRHNRDEQARAVSSSREGEPHRQDGGQGQNPYGYVAVHIPKRHIPKNIWPHNQERLPPPTLRVKRGAEKVSFASSAIGAVEHGSSHGSPPVSRRQARPPFKSLATSKTHTISAATSR